VTGTAPERGEAKLKSILALQMESRLASTMATLWPSADIEQPWWHCITDWNRGASNYTGLAHEAAEICEFAISRLGVVTSLYGCVPTKLAGSLGNCSESPNKLFRTFRISKLSASIQV
jgi:hypothetical protein